VAVTLRPKVSKCLVFDCQFSLAGALDAYREELAVVIRGHCVPTFPLARISGGGLHVKFRERRRGVARDRPWHGGSRRVQRTGWNRLVGAITEQVAGQTDIVDTNEERGLCSNTLATPARGLCRLGFVALTLGRRC
jgi:hypothetical protein